MEGLLLFWLGTSIGFTIIFVCGLFGMKELADLPVWYWVFLIVFGPMSLLASVSIISV